MFGSEILEVAIGLILVYLLLSMICSAVRELIESWMKTRAAHLERGIRELLHDRSGRELAAALYNHPLVHSLYQGDYASPDPAKKLRFRPSSGNLPSYIPAGNFAVALLDIVARGPSWRDAQAPAAHADVFSIEALRAAVTNVQNPAVQRALLTALDTARGDLAVAQANVEAWYDSTMDRVSGWYRRQTQFILFGLGLAITLIANVNTLTIADFLYRNDDARALVVAQAERVAADTTADTTVGAALGELETLRLPMGWDSIRDAPPMDPGRAPGRLAAIGRWVADSPFVGSFRHNPWDSPLYPVVGWLLTAIAVSLGAPFWFDLLNKVMVVRSTVKPHEKSPEESSEDRRRPDAPPPPHLGGAPPTSPGAPAPVAPSAAPAPAPAPAVPADEAFEPHEWAAGDDPHAGAL